MSPEQVVNPTHGIDTRSDQYSLGVVLYELLCGITPFSGDRSATTIPLLQKLNQDRPSSPSRSLDDNTSAAASLARSRRHYPRLL